MFVRVAVLASGTGFILTPRQWLRRVLDTLRRGRSRLG
jgi:hypothetical protein